MHRSILPVEESPRQPIDNIHGASNFQMYLDHLAHSICQNGLWVLDPECIWCKFLWPNTNYLSCDLKNLQGLANNQLDLLHTDFDFFNYFWLTILEIYLSTYLTQWQKNTVANQDCCSYSIVKFGHQIVNVNIINSQNLIVNFFYAFKKRHFRWSVFPWWLIHKCYWFVTREVW